MGPSWCRGCALGEHSSTTSLGNVYGAHRFDDLALAVLQQASELRAFQPLFGAWGVFRVMVV